MNNRRRLQERVATKQWMVERHDFYERLRKSEVKMAKRNFPHLSWRKRSNVDRQLERAIRKYGDYFG